MANPNQVWGQTQVTVDGALLNTEGKGSLKPGGPVRTSVEADNSAGHFTTSIKPSEVVVMVLLTAGVSVTSLQAIDNATLGVDADTGQSYTVRNAYVVDAVEASEGKAKVTFNGPPAEEELL